MKVPGFTSAELAIALGQMSDYKKFIKNGSVENVQSDAVVWDGDPTVDYGDGIKNYPWDSIATEVATSGIVSINSSNVGDASKQIKIYGLNKVTGMFQEEVITLHATDPVTNYTNSVNEYRFIYEKEVVTSTKNVGDITAKFGGSTGTVCSIIKANESRTQMAVYMVPEGYKLMIFYWKFGVTKQAVSGEANGELYFSKKPNGTSEAFQVRDKQGVNVNGTSSDVSDYIFGIEDLPSGSRFEVRSYASAMNENFTTLVQGVLIKK